MLSHHEIMWRETWPNLIMKMRDMPYYHYKPAKERKQEPKQDEDAIPGTREILLTKFAKYVER